MLVVQQLRICFITHRLSVLTNCSLCHSQHPEMLFTGIRRIYGRLTLSPTIINDSSFGIYFSMSYGVQYSVSIVYTYNFNVPSDATINGIEVVFRGYYTSFKARATSYYDSIGVKVYYTEGAHPAQPTKAKQLSSLSYLRTKKA